MATMAIKRRPAGEDGPLHYRRFARFILPIIRAV